MLLKWAVNMNIIYIRTSTEEQNPENQIKAILTLIGDQEYTVFEDRQSAWKDIQRPEFNKILGLLRKRKLTHLYVWDLDRIYRNRNKIVGFFQETKHYGCKIHSYRQKWLEELNSAPPPWNEIMKDLLIQVMGWMAEDESQKRSDRVKAAVRIKNKGTYSRKGNKWGRKALPKQTIDRVLKIKAENPNISIRGIINTNEAYYFDKNNNKKVLSKSTVHRILQCENE